MKSPLFKFFSSLKLAVLLLLSLAFVLAFATIYESRYGMRAVHVTVYGELWFAGLLFLLGVTLLCAAFSRYPWKRHQTGFVITHSGIIILLIGSVVTQRWGVDGSLPVTEGRADNEVILNDLVLVITDERSEERQVIPVREFSRAKKGDLLKVGLTPEEDLIVDAFLPRVVQPRKFSESPLPGVGYPTVQIRIQNDRFQLEEWLSLTQPEKATELSLGPAIVSFRKLEDEKAEKSFLSPTKNILIKKEKGVLVASHSGKDYRLGIEGKVGQWQPLGETGLEVEVSKYLPYAIVEQGELVSRSKDPVNPAVQLRLRRKGHSVEEVFTVFAFFPEFTTMHGKKDGDKYGVHFQMAGFKPPRESLAGVGNQRGELILAQSADDKSLYYRVLGKDGSLNVQGKAEVGKPVKTGWMDLQFEVGAWLPHSIADRDPQYIDEITGGDNFLAAIHIKPQHTRGGGFYLYEGMGKSLSWGGRDFTVEFRKESVKLPFRIHLDKFNIGKDPGTSKAATYESQVRVKGDDRDVASALISMNEPLQHGGYTFYQASYQMEEGKAPLSIFAVNYDPGRWLKYLGSILLCLGAVIMFYMNPHYFKVLLGHTSK